MFILRQMVSFRCG